MQGIIKIFLTFVNLQSQRSKAWTISAERPSVIRSQDDHYFSSWSFISFAVQYFVYYTIFPLR